VKDLKLAGSQVRWFTGWFHAGKPFTRKRLNGRTRKTLRDENNRKNELKNEGHPGHRLLGA
jgi:hypothetical protein